MEISQTIDGWRTGLEGRHLLKPNLAAHYPTAIRGVGLSLFESDGRRYFDASSGAMTANLGHGLGGISEVTAKRAETVALSSEISSATSPPNDRRKNSASLAKPLRIRESRSLDVTWTNPPNQGADIHAFCTNAS